MGRIPEVERRFFQPLSHATGGWHSRLSTSRTFIREIRVIVVKKILATPARCFEIAVQRTRRAADVERKRIVGE
jgi:hypothetical protein